MGLHRCPHLLGGDFPVLRGEREHLVAGRLDGSGLVAVDVAGVGAQHPLVGPQSGGDDGGVGLGAPHQKLHRSLRGLAQVPDEPPGPVTVRVHPVAGGLLHVGASQGIQKGGVAPLGVVTFPSNHGKTLLWRNIKAVCNADGFLCFGFSDQTPLAQASLLSFTVMALFL